MVVKQRTRRQIMMDLVREYMRIHGVTEFDLRTVSDWAVSAGKYHLPRLTPQILCQRELSRACRADHLKDSQGRDVRRMHSVPLITDNRQMYLWADITHAKPQHMRLSFQRRRLLILNDCIQHKTDVEYYNGINKHGQSLLPFDYNFNLDLHEREMSDKYGDGPPDGDPIS